MSSNKLPRSAKKSKKHCSNPTAWFQLYSNPLARRKVRFANVADMSRIANHLDLDSFSLEMLVVLGSQSHLVSGEKTT